MTSSENDSLGAGATQGNGSLPVQSQFPIPPPTSSLEQNQPDSCCHTTEWVSTDQAVPADSNLSPPWQGANSCGYLVTCVTIPLRDAICVSEAGDIGF